MLLVGSKAVNFWFPNGRRSADWNVWMTSKEFNVWLDVCSPDPLPSSSVPTARHFLLQDGQSITIEVADERPSCGLFLEANAASPQVQIPGGGQSHVARPSTLMLAKRSHLHFPIEWEKHMADYHQLKAAVPDRDISPIEREAYSMRLNEHRAIFGQQADHPTLRITNKEFFASCKYSFLRLFEHDDLHLATAYYDAPLYYQLKEDKGLAHIPSRRFDALSGDDKVRMVREEAYAIALERVVIPSIELGSEYDANAAFGYALKRLCTDLTKGWFRDFAIDHYPDIRHYDKDYVRAFVDAVTTHRICRKHPKLTAAKRTRFAAYLERLPAFNPANDARVPMP
jgi:hypothetical protein